MLTKLTPLELYAVSVPKEAYEYSIFYTTKDTDNFWWLSYRFLKTGITFEDLANKAICTNIPSSEKIKIVGEVTKDSISFDPVQYVGKEIIQMPLIDMVTYTNYQVEDEPFENKYRSFYSLLSANGVHFVNPIPKPKMVDYYMDEFEKMNKWQSYESNLVDKVVILKQV